MCVYCIVLRLCRVSQNNALSECYWTHSALAQSPVADSHCVQKSIFWSFLTKTKQDRALPSHVHGKIWPQSARFWLWFFLLVLFLGHPVVLISSGNIGSILKPSERFWTHPEIDWKRSKVFETFKKYKDSFVIIRKFPHIYAWVSVFFFRKSGFF